MNGVTYDTAALVAGERNDRRMWALHAGFLAEARRGGAAKRASHACWRCATWSP